MSKELKEKIEAIAEALVLTDITDLQALAQLHTSFEELTELSGKSKQKVLLDQAKLALQLVADVMLDNVADPGAAMETVSKIISAFQEIVCHGRKPEEVAFPSAQGKKEEAVAPLQQQGASVNIKADITLLGDFVLEAMEHIHEINNKLLVLEKDPADEDAINAIFRAFHTIKGVAGFLELNEVRSLSHEAESLLDLARKGEIVLAGDLIDLTFEVADTLKSLIELVNQYLNTGVFNSLGSMLDDLVVRIKSVRTDAPVAGEQRIQHVQRDVQSKENKEAKEVLVNQGAQVREAIKIDAQRLDRLVDMIGELVIAESMVSQYEDVRKIESPKFTRYLSQLDKISRELHEIGMSLRMVPMRNTFQKMARMVRDLAKKMQKDVEFSMSGEDTELDKTVVDMIHDPLVHMIRNALDHGLESSSEDRVAAGKPARGNIHLKAYHKGGSIYMEIRDDGRGLDKEAILKKARERGLIQDGVMMSDRDIYNLIFEPGFSTAVTVTDVSGRGVGMDVVKKNIESLHGQIDIHSVPGQGSIFTLRLPLTLAIIDGMFVRIGNEKYIIPSLSIVRSIRPEKGSISTVINKGEMLSIKGTLIPIFRVERLFDVPDAQQDLTQAMVVVVEDEGHQIGLVVDELLGQQQVVIKNLGELMKNRPGISGCTIMPDGNVGLILDIASLVRLAEGHLESREIM